MKIRPLGAELFQADGRTDGQTDRQTDMTTVIVVYRNFSNTPKKQSELLHKQCSNQEVNCFMISNSFIAASPIVRPM